MSTPFTIPMGGPSLRTLPRPSGVGIGRARKVALVGNGGTWNQAPYDDPSWEIWSHTSSLSLVTRVDRFFELHPKVFWSKGKTWHRDYVGWLKTNTVPIVMQEQYRDVPASVKYPKDRVLAEFRPYFTSQTAWMIALALTEGVTHLGFFGIHYAHYTEYATQRSGCEYWMGVAEGRGVQLVIPDRNPLLNTPELFYGYESHSAGALHPSYHYVPTPKAETPTAPVVEAVDETQPPAPRLRDLGEPVAWDRSGYPSSQWKE